MHGSEVQTPPKHLPFYLGLREPWSTQEGKEEAHDYPTNLMKNEADDALTCLYSPSPLCAGEPSFKGPHGNLVELCSQGARGVELGALEPM